MALPTFVGLGTAVVASLGGNATASPIAGYAANDILLGAIETDNRAVTTPTNWTEVPNSPQGTGTAGQGAATRLSLYWRRATGDASDDMTFTDPGDHALGQIAAVRGCPTTGDPWDVDGGVPVISFGTEAVSDADISIPGETTVTADCLILAIATTSFDGGRTASAWTNADLATVADQGDATTATGNGGGLSWATGEKAAAGAYGATTATLSGATTGKAYMTVALKPAAGGGGVVVNPLSGRGGSAAEPLVH